MRSFTVDTAQAIQMLGNKANLPESVTKALFRPQLGPVTDDVRYLDKNDVSLGRPPLLAEGLSIPRVHSQALRFPGYPDPLFTTIETTVEVLGVQVQVPIYFCELKRLEEKSCLAFDHYKFYPLLDGDWRVVKLLR